MVQFPICINKFIMIDFLLAIAVVVVVTAAAAAIVIIAAKLK